MIIWLICFLIIIAKIKIIKTLDKIKEVIKKKLKIILAEIMKNETKK